MADERAPAEVEQPHEGREVREGESPYKNLFVPLVLVPAAIVATILFVFVMFSSITGQEADMEANLERVLHGGRNEREQALFNLVRQLEENRIALLDPERAPGDDLPWPIEPSFAAALRRALGELPADDARSRMVVAGALSQVDAEEGARALLELLAIDDEADPDGSVRFQTVLNLAATEAAAAQPALVATLADRDPGLRAVAAVALQRFPGSGTAQALSGVLDDESFDVRANAALSLAKLGDERAAAHLRGLALVETYDAERSRDKARFARAERVSEARIKAIEALGRLGLPADRALFERLAAEDDDLGVREAAMRALR